MNNGQYKRMFLSFIGALDFYLKNMNSVQRKAFKKDIIDYLRCQWNVDDDK